MARRKCLSGQNFLRLSRYLTTAKKRSCRNIWNTIVPLHSHSWIEKHRTRKKKHSGSFWQNDWWTGTRSWSVISPAFPWDPGLRRFRTVSVWSNSCDGRILPPVLESALWWMPSAPSLACCSHPICNSHLGTLKRKSKNGRNNFQQSEIVTKTSEEQHQRHVPQQNSLWNPISAIVPIKYNHCRV